MQVNADFDPLLAKLIVCRPTLDEVSRVVLSAERPCQAVMASLSAVCFQKGILESLTRAQLRRSRRANTL